MLAEERFRIILETVEAEGAVSVTGLCETMGVSEATARRDLNTLAAQGKLSKVHGGAVSLNRQFEAEEPSVAVKEQLHMAEKNRIARYAAGQIHDDDLVFLDAGTTILQMAEYLGKSKATFVTNGITCARRLVQMGLRAYVIGGLLKPGTEAIVGGAALEAMRSYNFTKAFHGITPARGFTTPDTEEAYIKAKAVEQAYMTYILADSSKFGKVAAVTVCGLDKACILTDRLPDESYRKQAVIKEVEA